MKKLFRTLFFIFAIIFILFSVSTTVIASVTASKRDPSLQGEKIYSEMSVSIGSMAALYYAAQENALLYEITAEQVRQYEAASGNDYYLPYDLDHKTFMAEIAPDVEALLIPLSNEKYEVVSQTVKSNFDSEDTPLSSIILEVDVHIREKDKTEINYLYCVLEPGVSQEQCMEIKMEKWDYYVYEEYKISEELTALVYLPDSVSAAYSGSYGAWTQVERAGGDQPTIIFNGRKPYYLQECEMVSYAEFLKAYDGEEVATMQTAADDTYTTCVILLVSQAACLVVTLACLAGWLISAKREKRA